MIDLAAAESLLSIAEAGVRTKSQQQRESALAKHRGTITRMMRRRFRAQKKAVMKPGLKSAFERFPLREDGREKDIVRDEAAAYFLAAVNSAAPSVGDAEIFENGIRAAIQAAAPTVHPTVASTESFEAQYLRDGGFTRLTGDLNQTSVKQLADAVADAWERGESFDGIKAAVREKFTEFSDYRAEMIAQQELNDAYNQSLLHFGREAGALFKSWETDLLPCLICVANETQGSIPIEQDFLDGSDAPPSHVNCRCSLSLHMVEGQ